MNENVKKDRIRPGVFLRRYGRIIVGAAVLIALVLAALCAPLIATHDPAKIDAYNVKQYPSREHLMGTDQYGRDIFSRVVYGTRISLLVGVAVAFFSALFGVILGLLMGYYRRVDAVVMRILESRGVYVSTGSACAKGKRSHAPIREQMVGAPLHALEPQAAIHFT